MKKMTLMQHFSELRRRILWCALIFLFAFIAGWYLSPLIQGFLTLPLLKVWPDVFLLYTGLSDGLMVRLSLSGLFALIVIIPVVLWHVWAFVRPGLKKSEQKFIFPILVMSPILFMLGACFAFYFLMPIVFKFFVGLNQTTNVPNVMLPVVRDYLRFVKDFWCCVSIAVGFDCVEQNWCFKKIIGYKIKKICNCFYCCVGRCINAT